MCETVLRHARSGISGSFNFLTFNHESSEDHEMWVAPRLVLPIF